MNQVKFHFFNVNHGDSILIEIDTDENIFYIIVDCYLIKRNGRVINPAIDYLKTQKAKTISAIIITHFHKDHYTGIEEYFSNFEVQKLCIPPVISRKSSSFEKIIESYKKEIKRVAEKTNEKQIFNELKSLVFLIDYIRKNESKVQEIEGKESIFRISDLNDAIGIVYLPVAKFKGYYVKKIIEGNFTLNAFPEVNDMSVAICFTFFGNKVLLAGDSTVNQWNEHIKQMKHDKINDLNIDMIKASHHGSKKNNNYDLFSYYFNETEKKRRIFVSADGKSHPHDVIFDLINKYNLEPHCTNLARQCANQEDYFSVTSHMAETLPFIINYEMVLEPIPCQGDITLQINKSDVFVKNSTGIKCLYH